MIENKELISKIADIENWSEFEEFVKGLYSQNEGILNVERNYKAKGLSGRMREVDVLVTLGFTPHLIKLGVECKYWSSKVDGDIIDVAFAKKEDLRLDKFAVITTIGFEAGAALYAKNKGIDLFLIRPSEDDDFGYSGRYIKFKLCVQGSQPINAKFEGRVVCEKGQQAAAIAYVQSKMSALPVSENITELNPELDLFLYEVENTPEGASIYKRGARAGNLGKVVFDTWRTQNYNFWDKKPASVHQKIIFERPRAIFFPNSLVSLIDAITFDMQYIKSIGEFEVDRGAQYPLILENVIEQAITPLIPNAPASPQRFKMGAVEPKREVNLADKPEDAVGREGVSLQVQSNLPMNTTDANPSTKFFELAEHEGKYKWREIVRSSNS